MTDSFIYDVFLTYSRKDDVMVSELAKRLKQDGLLVWHDVDQIKPGDSIPAQIEDGLEHSRVLVLCMSVNAFGSDWAQLEAYTFRFRDPLNKERRFIPIRLDDSPIKGSLAQFQYINWNSQDPEHEYSKLLDACRKPQRQLKYADEQELIQNNTFSFGHTDSVMSVAWSPDGEHALSGSDDKTIHVLEVKSGKCLDMLVGHTGPVRSVAWSPNGEHALSGSNDNTLRVWEVRTGKCLHVLKGHTDPVISISWSPYGEYALSGSDDKTLRVWEVKSGKCLLVLEGHKRSVMSVAWSPDGKHLLSGSLDKTLRLWEVKSGECLHVLEGHTLSVISIAWSPFGEYALSGSNDRTLRVWEVKTGKCLSMLKGHKSSVWNVAYSPDGQHALSGSLDNTIRLWDVKSGKCLNVLEGHTDSVMSVSWSPDGEHFLSGSFDKTIRVWEVKSGKCLHLIEGHKLSVMSVALSSDGMHILSGSLDKTLRLWEVKRGECLHVLQGHSLPVRSVALSPNSENALSGSNDRTLRVWEVNTGKCLHVLKGHTDSVISVAWEPYGELALSGSDDRTVRVWEVKSGTCLHVLEGHTHSVISVAWSPDGMHFLSGSSDKTLRLWEVKSGECLLVLQGHSLSVGTVAWSPNGEHALSGSNDNTLRVWEVKSGKCLRVLEGHTDSVKSVAWSSDGMYLLSGSLDKTVRVWEVKSGKCLHVLEGQGDSVMSVSWSPDGEQIFSSANNGLVRIWGFKRIQQSNTKMPLDAKQVITPYFEEHIQYTNAKVLLVGDTSAGKTGLSMRLALNKWEPSDSTVGAWATQWKLPVTSSENTEREIWLWDFGGQADQRLIHQLYMDETALAVLVFDGQKDDLFETLGQWDRDITRASQKGFAKLLVAGRVDAGGLRVSRNQLESFSKERGFANFLETSAKTGENCEELKHAILHCIKWEDIPFRSSPVLFKRLKEEIVQLRDTGRVLMRFNELRDALRLHLVGKNAEFNDEELKAVISLLAGPGIVWELSFGSWVLLQPERINAYAQAVIQTMREDKLERGCITEERVLKGNLTYQSSMKRLEKEEERFILLAMYQTVVERGLCLREQGDLGSILIFPTFYRRERPELMGHPAVLVSYRFSGFLDDIYATMVVRLHHTKPFQQDQLWRYAADFKTLTGKKLGFKLTRRAEGAGEIEVYFELAIPLEEKIIFSRYIHEHLLQKGQDVVRLRHYVCPHCGTPVGNREVAMKRLENRKMDILCVNCEKRIPLWDEMEELFANPEMKKLVRELEEQSTIVIDCQSKERALVGEVISTVALAGQISREFNVSDQGIDMEIEFKNDVGEATGRKLYLQLKSGNSYLRERKSDKAEIFIIKNERHARYWMEQEFPVLLVIRNSEGEVRWMEVRDWLKTESVNGKKTVKQVVFVGERFDVMSVRRWRERML